MATFAANRLGTMVDNTRTILAIEYLAAAQGISFHAPLETSHALAACMAVLRREVPVLEEDRLMAPDICAAESLIRNGALIQSVQSVSLPSVETA